MSNFTTIQITKDVKQKLDLMKGENNETYNSLIINLLDQAGGVFVEDIVRFQREKVAFTLEYIDDTSDKSVDVSFYDLHTSKVGQIFKVVDKPVGVNWSNSTAEVLVRKGHDIILLITDSICTNGDIQRRSNFFHMSLF